MSMQLRLDRPISNSTPEHVVLVFELFFRFANSHVRIFGTRLRKRIFDDPGVVREAECALQRGVRISVFYQDPVPENTRFHDLLVKAGMRVEPLTSQAADNVGMSFVVMDARSVRIEPDRSKCEAQVYMYAPEMAASLNQRFDSLCRKQTTIPDNT